jgi:hypothetical protein
MLARELESEVAYLDRIAFAQFPLVRFLAVEGNAVPAVQVFNDVPRIGFRNGSMFFGDERIVQADIAADVFSEGDSSFLEDDLEPGEDAVCDRKLCIPRDDPRVRELDAPAAISFS